MPEKRQCAREGCEEWLVPGKRHPKQKYCSKQCCDKVRKKAYQQTTKYKAYQKAYQQTTKYKVYKKAYQKTYKKAYQQTPKHKAYKKAYQQTTKYKAYKKAYEHVRKLFEMGLAVAESLNTIKEKISDSGIDSCKRTG